MEEKGKKTLGEKMFFKFNETWLKKSNIFYRAPASWIKVVGMLPSLPTYTPHPELSQAGSLKQTHLVKAIDHSTLA